MRGFFSVTAYRKDLQAVQAETVHSKPKTWDPPFTNSPE